MEAYAPHHWRGGEERKREKDLKVGRSEGSRTTWAAVKGIAAVAGTMKMEAKGLKLCC